MREAVIVSTARTPIGKAYRGAFNDTQAQTLGGHAIEAALGRAGISGAEVDDVVMGAALQQGSTGGNVARQCALRAGLPTSVAASLQGSVGPVVLPAKRALSVRRWPRATVPATRERCARPSSATGLGSSGRMLGCSAIFCWHAGSRAQNSGSRRRKRGRTRVVIRHPPLRGQSRKR